MAAQVTRNLGAVFYRFDLSGIAFEQFLHGLRHIIAIKGAVFAVAQHCGRAVVTGNDDISAPAGVKHIVGRMAVRCWRTQPGRF